MYLMCSVFVFRETLEAGVLEIAASLVHSKSHLDLVDFDNHLDNICLDWSNPDINDMLSHAT